MYIIAFVIVSSMNLPPPLDTFQVEKHAGEYKDFGSSTNYPLSGVTYPTDYGDIEGYIGEDGAKLDLFVGSNGECHGFIRVFRPELPDGEHKYYVNLTIDEEVKVINEFKPILLEQVHFQSIDELVNDIQKFKTSQL